VSAAQGWMYVYNQLKKEHRPVANANLADMGAQGWTEGAALASHVNPDCEAAAYDFLNWIVSPKGSAIMAEGEGYTPANPGAAKYLSPAVVKELGLDDPKALLGSAILKQAVANPQAYNQTMEEVIAGLK
jgi:spermidine/putrescine-binding protein